MNPNKTNLIVGTDQDSIQPKLGPLQGGSLKSSSHFRLGYKDFHATTFIFFFNPDKRVRTRDSADPHMESTQVERETAIVGKSQHK